MRIKFLYDLYFNSLNSSQDEVDNIERTELGLEYRYLLKHKWYLSTAIDFLSNTEQALKLRTNGRLGGGYFPAKNNVLYWGIGAGLNANIENFSNDVPDRQSLEAYIAILHRLSIDGGKALYVVPLKALAKEKYEDLKNENLPEFKTEFDRLLKQTIFQNVEKFKAFFSSWLSGELFLY